MNEREYVAVRFEEHRTQLRAVAYRMLVSLSEVDDAVQEAWLRLSRTDATSAVVGSSSPKEVTMKRGPALVVLFGLWLALSPWFAAYARHAHAMQDSSAKGQASLW